MLKNIRNHCWNVRRKRVAPEGTWVLWGGIEIPAKFYVYGAKIHKFHVRKVIKNKDAEQA